MEHDFIVISSFNRIGTPAQIALGPISSVMLSLDFKRKLAAAMVMPIRRQITYSGYSRCYTVLTNPNSQAIKVIL